MSPNNYIQFLSGISILAGMILCARKGYLSSVSLLVVPIAYLIYFSSQRVMIVRNLLVLVPFMAIFCAMGIYGLIERWMPSKAVVRHLVN